MKLQPALAVAAICCLTLHGAYAADVNLSGSAFYRERIALPQGATLLVELIDVTKPDAALSTATVAPAGRVPIAFSLVVDSNKLWKGGAYAIQARIEVGGSTWFANAEPIAVDPARAGEPLSVLLVQVGSNDVQEGSGVSLARTEWRVLNWTARAPIKTSRQPSFLVLMAR
jgi:putative lipoprotein